MENIRGKILWIDDEIQHLKPHIMYLESKGYNIDSTNNGNDGVILAKKNKSHLTIESISPKSYSFEVGLNPNYFFKKHRLDVESLINSLSD